jgi:hypothetical protein
MADPLLFAVAVGECVASMPAPNSDREESA